jgi:hypothetical protein
MHLAHLSSGGGALAFNAGALISLGLIRAD